MCFHCGEKYSPDHHYTNQAQLQTLELEESPTYLSEGVLDVVTSMEDSKDEDDMFLSLNAIVGTTNARTIRLRAIVGK